MIRICFVCLGNICRSPMAEYIMKDKINKLNLKDIYVTSRGTSYEEQGNDMYPPAKEELDKHNIKYDKHTATRLEKEDYEKYDYFICMEDSNIRSTLYIFDDPDNKIIKLLDKNVSDPWYTGDFSSTYKDIEIGTNNIIKKLFK